MPYCDQGLSVAAETRECQNRRSSFRGRPHFSTKEIEQASASTFSASKFSAEARQPPAGAGRWRCAAVARSPGSVVA
jgi:hypothetical protein